MPHPLAIPPPTPLQPEFESLVSDARNGLCSGLGALLDSLYLYGSVSRGNARPGQSDLDLTVVLARPPSREESNALERIRLDLQARHPEVSKVDFDLGVREDVLKPANLHSWGYWIKHECRCIHGTDLALQFPAFAPSRTIALAINGDYVRALGDYAQRIDDASEPGDRKRLQREAARKLIRATNVLRAAEDSCWPRTLEEHAGNFGRHHPDMAAEIGFFLAESRAPNAPGRLFNDRLQRFVDWMQQLQPTINAQPTQSGDPVRG